MPRHEAELWWGRKSPEPGVHVLTGQARRATLEPKLRQIISVGSSALEEFGVVHTSQRRVVVWSVGTHYPHAAEALTRATSWMLLYPYEQEGNIDMGWRNQFMAHEFLHNARMEHYMQHTLGELAASEGLSHIGAARFTNPVRRWKTRGPQAADRVLDLPKSDIRRIAKGFEHVIESPNFDNPDADVWLRETCVDRVCLRRLEIVGIAAVAARMREGNDFAEIITWPPEAVLGYA